VYGVFRENQYTIRLKKTSEKGKPGESRGRKANGSTVTIVTMIARPPKIIDELSIFYAASLDSFRARLVFFQ
jgi:hypothetical protein